MSDVTAPNPASPARIPGLQLGEKIGEGGMSAVYRATHLNLQREVAVKILQADDDDEETVPAWLRESRLMASLVHPHVVAIHDAGQVEDRCYLVMEYMGGGSLRSKMEAGRPWPLSQAVAVLDDIAQALSYIHEKGILHLDLKPENILYTADGQLKITDFGLSVPSARATALIYGRSQGTLDYCAPEQRAGLAFDVRCDVFSLATLAYELLTGRLPGRVYVPASQRNPSLPKALDEVLRRGLARNPKERYASVSDFRQALASASRSTQSPAKLRWSAAMVGLATLVVVLFAVSRRNPRIPGISSLSEHPTHLWILYDKAEDLALFTSEDSRELPHLPDVSLERIQIENPAGSVPPEIPFSVWPKPRPTLVLRSPGGWGVIHPLQDRTLGQRAASSWPTLLRAVIPAGNNLVRAGDFEGDCLARNDRGKFWRVADDSDWGPSRSIRVERPAEQPDNPALLLTDLGPTAKKPLSCYQPLTGSLEPGDVLVLRYRARAPEREASLSIYTGMTVAVPADDKGPAATRIRGLGLSLLSQSQGAAPNQWWYRSLAWIRPTDNWQTYVIVTETPALPFRILHRNLGIELTGSGQIWVDDVELFVWRPGDQS